MGTTSEKLTYLNGTKQKLKQAINNIGGEVTDETTFREYVNQLENAYDRLPKTEFEEGESITLENTLKGKLDFQDGKVGFGQTEQDSTQGYQLAKPYNASRSGGGITWVTQNSQISASGSTSSNEQSVRASDITNDMIISLPSGTYCISGGRSDLRLQIVKYDNGSVSQLALDSGSGATFTLNETTNIVYRGSIPAGTTLTGIVTIKAMLESGTTAHSWEKYTGGQASPNPSYPQQIKSVTGNQDVVVSGKNEINVPEIVMSARSYIYRANIGSGNYSISITKSRVDGVTIGNQYAYMYKEIKFYNSNDTLLSTNTGTSAPSITTSPVTKVFNFTAPQNTSYMEIEFSNNNGDNKLNTLLSNVMLVEGTYNESTMPTYEPYITPTSYQLSLGEYKFYGIPNTDYRDELVYDINEDKVYKKSNTIRYTADELTWSHFSVAQGDLFRTTPVDTIKGTSGYSNYYICKTQPTRTDPCFYVNADNPLIDVIDNRYSDTTNFKNWCVTNNVEWIIPRATPTLTEITGPTLINQVKALYNAHSLNGTTIITSNGDLPMIIKCRALKGE